MRFHGGQGFFADLTDRFQMLLILEAVFACDGNMTKAARILGMSYSALRNRYDHYNRACAEAAAGWNTTLAERSHR